MNTPTKIEYRQDWNAAASPLPAAPRMDSAQTNAFGKTRQDMLRDLLGDGAAGLTDTQARQKFCKEFARRIGSSLTFDDVSDMLLPLYFESRFDEWKGLPPAARADSADAVMVTRYDEPELDGRVDEVSGAIAPLQAFDFTTKPDTLTLDRKKANKFGWTVGAMVRGTLGSRADGLDDLAVARVVAKDFLPAVDMASKSVAYLSRLVEIRHEDWQPPDDKMLRNLLQDADAPARFDDRED